MNPDHEWLTRATLLQRVRDRHDQESWSEFIKYYQRYVHSIIRRMGLNHHDAEEVGQAVMVKLWDKLPEFEYDPTKGRFRGWLCRVTGNEVKMFHRQKMRAAKALAGKRKADLETYLSRVHVSDIDALAEEEWAAYITSLAWNNIQGRFDGKTKETFERVSKGESAEEVGSSLGLAPSSVYVYKKRVEDCLCAEIMRLNRELD